MIHEYNHISRNDLEEDSWQVKRRLKYNSYSRGLNVSPTMVLLMPICVLCTFHINVERVVPPYSFSTKLRILDNVHRFFLGTMTEIRGDP